MLALMKEVRGTATIGHVISAYSLMVHLLLVVPGLALMRKHISASGA